MSDLNIWGTDKAMINADEYCVECEHTVGSHYTNCPLHTNNLIMSAFNAFSAQRKQQLKSYQFGE